MSYEKVSKEIVQIAKEKQIKVYQLEKVPFEFILKRTEI